MQRKVAPSAFDQLSVFVQVRLFHFIAGELGDSIQAHAGRIVRYKRIGDAAPLGAPRAADAVHVIFVFERGL